MVAYEINIKRKLTLKLNWENNIIMLVEFIRHYFYSFQHQNAYSHILFY